MLGRLDRIASFSEDDNYHPSFLRVFNWLKVGKFWVIGFWVACLLWGVLTGFRYIEMARDEMAAPSGSRAYNDNQKFIELFPEQSSSAPMIVFVQCLGANCSLTCQRDECKHRPGTCQGENPEMEEFSRELSQRVLAYSNEKHVGYSDRVLGYYNFSGTELDSVKCQFASTKGTEMFMVFSGSQEVASDIRYKLLDEVLKKIIPEINPDKARYKVGLTGNDPMIRDGSTAAVQQSEMIDAATMPFAFAMLAFMVRSWRLLLISLFNMTIAIMTSMAILAVLTDIVGKPPLTTTTSFVEVLGLAMSVDYSLFLLRRFRDEIKGGREPEMAIKIMMAQAGHVVMMSSLTIICVFGGFVFMKSTDLMVQGMACVTSVAMCLLVNMTNTPALLLAFPHFFSTFHFDSAPPGAKVSPFGVISDACKSCGRCLRRLCKSDDSDDSDEHSRTVSLLPDDDVSYYVTSPTAGNSVLRERGGPYKGFYFKVLLFITKWPNNVITLFSLYLMFVPLAMQALRLERNQNLLQGIPRHSESAVVYSEMTKVFPGGSLSPMYIVVEAESTIFSRDVFRQVHTLTEHCAFKSKVPKSAFNSLAVVDGINLPFPVARFCRWFKHFSFCAPYNFLWSQTVNSLNTSMLIMVTVPFDPFLNLIETFVTDIYSAIDEFAAVNQTKALKGVYFSGIQVGMVEDMIISFDEFPLLVFLTCLVVFTLLGFMLRSAFVVIRLTLTVILPLAAMFGLAVLVYQDGILDWTGITAVQSNPDGFFWYVPLLCFTICCGLALDYDVFVIARIREHRCSGYDIRASIIKAMWEINSTVVCAGLIMAIAFGGLMIADSVCVNQMSWILTSSVLFDTFVVQSVVVPCIMSFFDSWSWWPGKVPMTNLVTLEEEVANRNQAFAVFGISPTILPVSRDDLPSVSPIVA